MQPSVFTGITNLSSLRAYLVNDLDNAFNEEPTLDGNDFCQNAVYDALHELPTSTLTTIMCDPDTRYMWGMAPTNAYGSMEFNFLVWLQMDMIAMLMRVYHEMLDTYANQVESEASPWDDEYVAVIYEMEEVG